MIAHILQKMIRYSNGDLHDISHLLKVWGFARTIGTLEGLDAETQLITETAAIVHDIACPLCREKYGNASGKLQEQEGPALAEQLLQDTGLTDAQIARICFLVGHHHSPAQADGPDYRILLEADYLVNADEGHCSLENIRHTCTHMFRTVSGTQLLRSMYLREDTEMLIENMLRWAQEKLGCPDYAGWCLSFIEDALEISNGIEIFGGDSAKESAQLYADALRMGEPEKGAFVFYDCLCPGPDGPVNWGHCGISLGDGRIIHAWDIVRIDDYRAVEQLTALTGDHPRYIGWVSIERVLAQRDE